MQRTTINVILSKFLTRRKIMIYKKSFSIYITLQDKKIKMIDIYSLLENKLNIYDIENYDLYFNKSHLSKKGATLL